MMGRLPRLGVAGLAILALGAAAAPARAESTVLEIDWRVTTPLSGTVVDETVEVESTEGGVFPLAVVEPPDLGRVGYALRGEVRYTDVAGQGYLELWSVFADGGRFFTRTQATGGLMASLTRTSGWRPFELPFTLNNLAGPERLELNLVLPGAGKVIVGPVRLVRLDTAEVPDGEAGLSTDQVVGLVGGLAGGALGIAGGTIGWLVSRRRAPRAVIGALRAGIALGAGLVAIAIAAFAAGQPASVTYVCLLLGGITAGVSAGMLPSVRRAYAEAELRRMRALDRS